jgi:hypothetical protein
VYGGRAAFGAMEEVVFGRPAADAVVGQIGRFGAARAFLIVSDTLSRGTSGIKNAIRKTTSEIPRRIERPAPIRETLLLPAS